MFIERIQAKIRLPLFGNAYALIANTGITALLGFAYWVVAARLYDPSDVGLAAAVISAMTLLAGISQFNLEAVMVRFVPVAGPNTRRLVATVYAVCMAAAAVTGILFVLGLDIWAPTLGSLHARGWEELFVLATVSWVIFILQDGILVGLGRAIWVPIENAVFGLAKLGFLLVFRGGGPLAIFASWALPAIVAAVAFTALIFWRLIPQHTRKRRDGSVPLTVGMVRNYAVGDYLGWMFGFASISLLPLLVTYAAGPEENAFFYQSWAIAYTLTLIGENTSRSLMVEAAKDRTQLHVYSKIVLGHTLRILGPAVVALILLAPLVLGVFGPAYAAGGTQALRLLAVAAIPHTFVLLALVVARIEHRMHEVVAIQATVAVLALATSVVLVRSYGATGVAAAWLGSQSLAAIVLLVTRLPWLFRPSAVAAGSGQL